MVSLVLRFIIGVALIAGIVYFIRRKLAIPRVMIKTPGLRIVARVGVAKGATVIRLATGDKDLILGCTAQHITKLGELPASEEPIHTGDNFGIGNFMISTQTTPGSTKRQAFTESLREAIKGPFTAR